MLERFFGATITISTGRVVPVRLIGEQHVVEDLGFADDQRWADLQHVVIGNVTASGQSVVR